MGHAGGTQATATAKAEAVQRRRAEEQMKLTDVAQKQAVTKAYCEFLVRDVLLAIYRSIVD